MDLQALVTQLLPVIGQSGVDALVTEVTDLMAEARDPWKNAVLGLVANGVQTFGLQGVQRATDELVKLMDGDEADINWADLDVASDILAHMQNAEADRKAASRDFLAKVGLVLGQVFGGVLKGLIAAV
jgi:hypothetical protein